MSDENFELQREIEKYRELKRMRMIEKGRRKSKIKDQQIRQQIRLGDTSISCSSGIQCVMPSIAEVDANNKNGTQEDFLDNYIQNKRKLLEEAGQSYIGTVLALDNIENAYLISKNSSMLELCKIMAVQSVDSVLVIDDGSELCGIVTDKDVLLQCGQAESISEVLHFPVYSLMSENVIYGRIDEPIHELLVKMIDNKFRHIPIVDQVIGDDDGMFVIVGMIDILKIIDYIQSIVACSWGKVKSMIDAYQDFQQYWDDDTPASVKQWFHEWSIALPTLKSLYKLDTESHTCPLVVGCADSVDKVVKLMANRRATAAVVVDSQFQLVGIMTSKDLILRVISAELQTDSTPVSLVMTPYPDTADENMHIDQVLDLMSHNNYQHLPITSTSQRKSDSHAKCGQACIVGMADILSLTCFTLAQLIRRGHISRIYGSQSNSEHDVTMINEKQEPAYNRKHILGAVSSLVAVGLLLFRLARK